jgi:ABC-type arginine/histidine transport system permease subunit
MVNLEIGFSPDSPKESEIWVSLQIIKYRYLARTTLILSLNLGAYDSKLFRGEIQCMSISNILNTLS